VGALRAWREDPTWQRINVRSAGVHGYSQLNRTA